MIQLTILLTNTPFIIFIHSLEKNMSPNELPILLITANVGSIFEDPTNLFQQWMVQVYNKIRAQKPAFIGIHLQEVFNSLNNDSKSRIG